MTKVILIISLLQLIVLARIAVTETIAAQNSSRLEQSERAQLEAVYRTIGRKVDVAFVCKERL